MGYFKGLAEASFKDGQDGRKLFYPWGIFGKGYILPAPADYEALRDFFIRMYMVVLPLNIILVFVDMRLCFAFVGGYCLWYWWFASTKTAGLTVSDEKLKISEATTNSAHGHNFWFLTGLLTASILFTLMGFALLSSAPFLGALCITFFGLCSFMIFRMVRVKWADRHSG